jgi:hypothetical protein
MKNCVAAKELYRLASSPDPGRVNLNASTMQVVVFRSVDFGLAYPDCRGIWRRVRATDDDPSGPKKARRIRRALLLNRVRQSNCSFSGEELALEPPATNAEPDHPAHQTAEQERTRFRNSGGQQIGVSTEG